MIRNIKGRKGQEEMVGFVLIMVIVAVVFLIFLGIFIRKPSTSEKESKDIYQFLESAMEYTSDCAINNELAFEKVGALFKECHSSAGESCLNGKRVCDVLNDTLKGVIEKSWKISSDGYYKGYMFNSSYVENNRSVDSIIEFSKGNCTSFKGAEYPLPDYPGNIENRLIICF